MRSTPIVIALSAIGYSVALALLIISATYGDYSNLYLLFPMLLTPAMGLLIRSDADENDFWSSFGIFMITFGIISCIALPLTMLSFDAYKHSPEGSGYGLVYGLSATGALLTFLTGAVVVNVKGESNDW